MFLGCNIRYMCEITIETPIFYTDYREANLSIYGKLHLKNDLIISIIHSSL